MCAQTAFKVFISGTFKDIREYRDHVCKVLSEKDYLVVDLSTTDPRSMETKGKIDAALNASDYYICILGTRYGSRVEEDPIGPSWTHYEYHQFRERMARQGGNPELAMVVLRPQPESEAWHLCSTEAEAVYEREGLSKSQRRRDRDSQAFFRKLTEGGKIDPPHPSLIRPDNPFAPMSRQHAARTGGGSFSDTKDIKLALQDFMLLELRTLLIKSGQRPALEDGAPSAGTKLQLPQAVVDRLCPETVPPALCVVATHLKSAGLEAQTVTDALAHLNPWDAEKGDDLLNVADLTDRKLNHIVRVLGEEYFGQAKTDLDEVVEAIAARIARQNRTRMIRLQHVPASGTAELLLDTFWPKLQKAIAAKCSGGSSGRLLLIISADIGPGDIEEFCQRSDGKVMGFERPILLTAASVAPAAAPRTPTHQKGNIPA